MEFRKVFDTIPEKFDKWRPRYCKEAFDCIINKAALDPSKSVLEIGPGTGQATEPILKTNCDYLAIELGENLYNYTKNKFKSYSNFHIENGDFELFNYGDKKFDLVYSAATIQWIPEQIAFSKSFELLKNGGYLAMMMLYGDYKTPKKSKKCILNILSLKHHIHKNLFIAMHSIMVLPIFKNISFKISGHIMPKTILNILVRIVTILF